MSFSLILLIPLFSIVYPVLDRPERGVHSLVTSIDRLVPFLKIFIIPYIVWYPFIVLTLLYFCIKDRVVYYRTLISLLIGLCVCFVIFYLFQTTVTRPVLSGDDFLTRIVRVIYRSDQPYNCFPSIHVLESYLMIKAVRASKVKNNLNSFVIISTAVSIILATEFVKQHVILDIISAVFLGDIIFRISYTFRLERILSYIKKPFSLLMVRRKVEI
jgi:hypothetical protein